MRPKSALVSSKLGPRDSKLDPKGVQEGPQRCETAVQERLDRKKPRTSKFNDLTAFLRGFAALAEAWRSSKCCLEASLEGQMESKWRLEASSKGQVESKSQLECSLEGAHVQGGPRNLGRSESSGAHHV